jgi:hypothetical protein
MLPEPTAGEPYAKAYRDTSLYTEGMGYDLKDPSIRLCKLVPGIDIKLLQDRLKALLDDIPTEKTCQSIPNQHVMGSSSTKTPSTTDVLAQLPILCYALSPILARASLI